MKFKFLRETPQSDDTGLAFGHREIVSSLKNIICNEDQNLTIGLFGGWGTGKSSIVETLKKRLKAPKIPLVVFDVWKHEGDALRRTFLVELQGKLESEYGKDYFKEGYATSQRLKFSQNNSKEIFSVKWDKLKIHLTLLLTLGVVFLFMLLILNSLLSFLNADLFEGIQIKELTIAISGALSLTLLYKYIDYFIKVEKTEFKEERFQDPQEFELEFANIIANLSESTSKIVITFDNLDRVSGDNALKIISTVKTFLDYKSTGAKDKKTVFFLIPCDVISMRAHISFTDKVSEHPDAKEQYWDEFLRKFFNTSIWIPEFYPTELEKFANTKLSEVGIPEFKNDYLSYLIIKVFHKNPRQIIQFINILLSNYLVLKEFCEQNAFHNRQFYLQNVPQLAKFLLIKQRHAPCLEIYSNSGIYDLSNPSILEKIRDEKFKNLLHQTADIYIPSLEPYFKYRMSQSEQENENIVRFVDAVTSGADHAHEEVKAIDFEKDNQAFNNIVRTKLQNITNLLFKTDLIKWILDLAATAEFVPDKGLYKDLILFFSNPQDWRIVFRISPIAVMNGLLKPAPNITPVERAAIINHYIDSLDRSEDVTTTYSPEKLIELSEDLFAFVVVYIDILDLNQKQKVQTHLELNYLNPHIKTIFIEKEELQQTFITEVFINNVLSGFQREPGIHRGLHLFEMILKLNAYQANIHTINASLTVNYQSLLNQDNISSHRDLVIAYARLVHLHVERVLAMIDFVDENDYFTRLCGHLIDFFEGRSMRELPDYLPLLLSLTKYDTQNRRAIDLVLRLLQQDDEVLVTELFDRANGIFFKGLDERIREELISVFVKFESLRNLTENLSLTELASLAVKYAEEGGLDFARELIIRYRDTWDEAIRLHIVTELVALFSSFNEAYQSNQLFNRYIDLIFFASDNNIEMLASAGLWNILAIMLTEKDPLGVQRFAYETFKKHFDLLLPTESQLIIEMLFKALETREYDDDYLFHEALSQLIEKHPERTHDQLYIAEVFDQIIGNSVTTNMFIVCARAIEKFQYDLSDFIPEITIYLSTVERMHDLERHNAGIILKALADKLKNNRNPQFKDIRSKLRELK